MLREEAPMDAGSARLLSPLQLAYIGDSVWDLLIRSRLLYRGYSVHHMHDAAVHGVNAAAQARALVRLADRLTEDEQNVVLRGRNAHARHHAPRHQSIADYAAATGLEALIGYLYISGQEERLLELFRLTQEEDLYAGR